MIGDPFLDPINGDCEFGNQVIELHLFTCSGCVPVLQRLAV